MNNNTQLITEIFDESSLEEIFNEELIIKSDINIMSENKMINLSLDEFQCYLLGYIINNSYIEIINNQSYKLIINLNHADNSDSLIIQLLKNLLDSAFWNSIGNQIIINSGKICKNYLQIIDSNVTLPNSEKIFIKINKFPNLYKILDEPSNILFWTFIRGYIEKSSTLSFINNIPKCQIIFDNINFMNDFLFYINIPPNFISNKSENKYFVEYHSTNCIDLLGNIYRDKKNKLYNKQFFNLFESFINWKNFINYNRYSLDKCRIYKKDINAILPTKSNESDVGYDLTIIKEYKQLTPSTILYDTGIILNVDYGYYIEIVPRSSLSKSGYMLANSIGIIEKSYSGTLLVALTKIDKDMPDLTLPFKCCQLIFKVQISLHIEEMSNLNTLEKTNRNSGGFGSTNL